MAIPLACPVGACADGMMASMPTTLGGLFLFVVLLLPGFAYVAGRERHTPGQQFSAFRETAIVVSASVTFELVVLVAFAIVRALLPSVTPDVGALVRNSDVYLRSHYGLVTGWAVALLAVSVALAYSASAPAVRRKFRRFATEQKQLPKSIRNLVGDALGESPHESVSSAWWTLFDAWVDHRDKTGVRVRCFLEDGSYIEGELGSFSREADDKPDRDLFLVGPISFRPPSGDKIEPYEGADAVCISASRIVTMFVTYWKKPEATSPAASTGAAAVGEASPASPLAAAGGPQPSGPS